MRRALNGLYQASGALAALCLVLICLIVAAQVAGRIVDAVSLKTIGESPGFHIPSAAEISGFLFAASSFLALAYTLRHGDHIRVQLFLSRLTRGAGRIFEIWCLTVAGALSGFFACSSVLLVLDSFEFGEVSVGIVPIPLWIPQSFMALGLIVLTIAILDDLIGMFRGGEPSYRKGDDCSSDSTVPTTVGQE